MIQKLKALILSASLLFALSAPVLTPAMASAQTIQQGVCSGAELDVSGSTGCSTAKSTGNSTFQRYLNDIVNILSVIVGVVAVIMIIVGGFRYITSGGSSEKVTAAKNTILYGIIGLIIVALAQVIVRFILGKVTS